MTICDNMLLKIWMVALFCGFCLLLLCIPLVNSPPNTIFHDLFMYCGIIGGSLFVVCFIIACYFKPINRALFNDYQRQNIILTNDHHLPTTIIPDNVVIIEPHSIIMIEPDNILSKQNNIVIAEPVNSV